jgi:hypothetical protein
MTDIEPVPEDDPHLRDDPIYAAMSPAEQESHRRMLARMREWQRQQDAYHAAHPRAPDWQERIETLLSEQLELLKRIDAKLARLVERPGRP